MFWDEFTHLIFLGVAFALFVVSFKAAGKIGLAKFGPNGLQQLFAAA